MLERICDSVVCFAFVLGMQRSEEEVLNCKKPSIKLNEGAVKGHRLQIQKGSL